MKIGQTSLIVFVSKVVGSALGFVATIYFARVLGAEVLGVYALVITIVSWLKLGGTMGAGAAITKRLSEGTEQREFFTAGLISMVALGVVLSLIVVALRPLFEWYVADFDIYVSVSVVWFIVGLLFMRLFYVLITATLKGHRLVHIAGFLRPLKIGGQSLIQVALVVAGYGLAGMLVGYGISGVVVALLGLVYLSLPLARPSPSHFRSLYKYAKYSWLGKLESRTLNDIDILLLGAFVATGLVGVYAVAWSISNFLKLFGMAISDAMFPEVSHLSAQEEHEQAAALIEDALAYAGLIAIPGFIGGVILAEPLLSIYGPAFVKGTAVLALLILATLLYSYHSQLINALNGLDRPDLTFRINAVFIALNATANLVLILAMGWVGAAIATAGSTAIGVSLSYRALSSLIPLRVPVGEISRQILSGLFMGLVVWGGLATSQSFEAPIEAVVVTLVSLGALVYFLVLLAISGRFRETVDRNLPVAVPLLGS